MSADQEKEQVEISNEKEAVSSHAVEKEKTAENFLTSLGVPAFVLLCLIISLVVILVFISVSSASRNGEGSSSEYASQLDPNIEGLKAEIEIRRQELNRQRLSLNLPPIGSPTEPVEEIANRLSSDAQTLVKMVETFERRLIEKETTISARNADILRLENLRKDISAESARMANELQRALIAGDASDSIRATLDVSKAENDRLRAMIAQMTAELDGFQGAINADVHAQILRRLGEAERARDYFQGRVRELEAKQGGSNLFAETANQLVPAAVKLFGTLRGLEEMNDANLNLEYNKIETALKANVVHQLNFATGSSKLSQEDTDRLDQILINDVPDGDLILVVGYASVTGDQTSNRKLSSDRAKAAVNYMAKKKRAGQVVQGVYLGETDRFNSEVAAFNQICEVWRVRAR